MRRQIQFSFPVTEPKHRASVDAVLTTLRHHLAGFTWFERKDGDSVAKGWWRDPRTGNYDEDRCVVVQADVPDDMPASQLAKLADTVVSEAHLQYLLNDATQTTVYFAIQGSRRSFAIPFLGECNAQMIESF